MDGFFGLFDKLAKDLKVKLSIITIGLIMPSLLYFILKYTDEFYQSDLLKVMIICISFNFTILFVLTFINIQIKGITEKIRKKYIIDYKDKLTDKIENYNSRVKEYNASISEKTKIEEIGAEIEEESMKLKKQISLFKDYQDDFSDYSLHLSLASICYIFVVIANLLIYIFIPVNMEFTRNYIIKEVKQFIIIYTITVFLINVYIDISQVKSLDKVLNDQD